MADKYGGQWTKKILDASQSDGAQFVSNLVQSAPTTLGKWAPSLIAASKRGGNALAATDYVLQNTDPDYRKHIQNLKNNGQ